MAKSRKTSKRPILDPGQYQPPEVVRAYLDSAEQSLASGDFPNALEIYRKILAIDKYFLLALKQMALCELQMNTPQNAIKHLVKYTKSVTNDPEACAYLAQAYLITGQASKAKQSILRALKLAQTADLYFLAASIEEQINDPAKAISHYERGLALAPHHTSANIALGIVHKNLGNFNQAIQLFETALSNEPDNTNAMVNLGNVYHTIGLYERAIDNYHQAQRITQNADIAYNLGLSLQQLLNSPESTDAFKHAVELDPRHLDAQFQIAENLSELGNFAEANEVLDSIIAANPGYVHAWYAKSQYNQFGTENSEIEKRLLAFRVKKQASEEASLVHFGLAKICDDTQRYDEAFEHFCIANKYKTKKFRHAAEQQLEQLSNAIINHDKENIDFEAAATEHPIPIFIIGMPRSGTTLLERGIARAEAITACGEIDFFGPALFRLDNKLGEFRTTENHNDDATSLLNCMKDNYLKRVRGLANTTQYFIDKTPDNFRLVRTLESLFPNAKFVHCTRNPLDTCFSIYCQNFANVPYSYDLDHIAKYYLMYHEMVEKQRQRLKGKNKWIDVVYEEYVSNEKTILNEVSTFLDCEINGSSVDSASAKSPIRSVSKWQARQGTYQNSVGRWERYKDKLTELESALSTIL